MTKRQVLQRHKKLLTYNRESVSIIKVKNNLYMSAFADICNMTRMVA